MDSEDSIYITLSGEDGDVVVEVLEQTVVNGITYVLVVEKNEDEDIEYEDCFILKDVSNNTDTENTYETIEDLSEFEEVSEIFRKMLLHDDIELIREESDLDSE